MHKDDVDGASLQRDFAEFSCWPFDLASARSGSLDHRSSELKIVILICFDTANFYRTPEFIEILQGIAGCVPGIIPAFKGRNHHGDSLAFYCAGQQFALTGGIVKSVHRSSLRRRKTTKLLCTASTQSASPRA